MLTAPTPTHFQNQADSSYAQTSLGIGGDTNPASDDEENETVSVGMKHKALGKVDPALRY